MILRLTITSVFLLSLWAGFVKFFDLPIYILPSPDDVFFKLIDSLFIILNHSFITCLEIIIGYVCGTFFGMVTALTMSHFSTFRQLIQPLLLITQAIPVFVIAPLIILWCGYGMASKIIMITFLLYFTITSNFYDGLKRTPQHFLDMAQLMKVSRLKTLLHIQIPSALPQLFSGLRLGAAFAPIAALIGEWVGASQGLGFLILDSYTRVEMPLLFACLFVLILISLSFYHIVFYLTRRFTPWIEEKI